MLRTQTVKVENRDFGQQHEIAQFRHKTVFPHPDIVENFIEIHTISNTKKNYSFFACRKFQRNPLSSYLNQAFFPILLHPHIHQRSYHELETKINVFLSMVLMNMIAINNHNNQFFYLNSHLSQLLFLLCVFPTCAST